MGKEVSWFDTKEEEREDWESICPVNEYRIIDRDQLPKIIPCGLVDKTDSIFVVASGTESGTTFYMANMHRVDEKDCSIDQEPFALAFLSNGTTTSGCLIHHGKWDKRITKPPEEFWDYVTSSGIGNCYPLPVLPNTGAGNLEDLNMESQEGAFQAACAKLRNNFNCE